MPAYAGIQILDSGFRRNDDASVGVLYPIENKSDYEVYTNDQSMKANACENEDSHM